jgi:hypothetical protein
MAHQLLLDTHRCAGLIEQRTIVVAESVPSETGNSDLFTPRLQDLPLDDARVVAAPRDVRREDEAGLIGPGIFEPDEMLDFRQHQGPSRTNRLGIARLKEQILRYAKDDN